MFDLTIATPEKVLFQGKATSLTAPGKIGYLEILKDHAPLITTLQKGRITVKNGEPFTLEVEGGILEISKNRATILTDEAGSIVYGTTK